jgi:hypothetical protein
MSAAPAERIVPVGAFGRLQEDPVHRHLRPSPPVLADHSQLTTSLLLNARWEELFSEPDHRHPRCSRRHRRSRGCGDHSHLCDHLQDAALPAVGPLPTRHLPTRTQPSTAQFSIQTTPARSAGPRPLNCHEGTGRRLPCAAVIAKQISATGAPSAGGSVACCSFGRPPAVASAAPQPCLSGWILHPSAS